MQSEVYSEYFNVCNVCTLQCAVLSVQLLVCTVVISMQCAIVHLCNCAQSVRKMRGLQYIGAGLQYIGAPKFYFQDSGKE